MLNYCRLFKLLLCCCYSEYFFSAFRRLPLTDESHSYTFSWRCITSVFEVPTHFLSLWNIMSTGGKPMREVNKWGNIVQVKIHTWEARKHEWQIFQTSKTDMKAEVSVILCVVVWTATALVGLYIWIVCHHWVNCWRRNGRYGLVGVGMSLGVGLVRFEKLAPGPVFPSSCLPAHWDV